MSDTKFTSGPWRVDECGDVRSIEDDKVIAVVLSDTDEFKTARLIASAPDLYTTLDNLLKYSNPSPGQEELYQDGWAVLAKARGEADQ